MFSFIQTFTICWLCKYYYKYFSVKLCKDEMFSDKKLTNYSTNISGTVVKVHAHDVHHSSNYYCA